MRKNLGVQACLYPMPVLIIGTYNEDKTANAMTATWGGVSNYNQIFIYLSHNHRTVTNILEQKAFTVSIADAEHVVACDYIGLVSAHEVKDKLSKAGLHSIKSDFVNAPVIEELPMTFECELDSYDKKTCILKGKIINLSVDDIILNSNGKIDPLKLRPITFDSVNNEYLVIGEKVGNALLDGMQLKG